MKFLFVLLFLVSCSSHQTKQPEVPQAEPRVIEPSRSVEVKTKVNLTLSEFNDAQATRLFAIGQKVEKIINSPEFKDKVINFYTKGKRKFNETTKPNEEVYETMIAKSWEVKIELARGGRNVLGWTNPNTEWIWFNSRYFDGRDDSGLAGTFCHEWSHKLGFGHAFRNYNGREYTVPYGLGTICAQLYQ